MAKGISIHIGLNRVDPDQYEGWEGELGACEADARDMAALAKKQGFTSSSLILTKAATATAVTSAIKGAAKSLGRGDILFLTYSGHGGQVKDTNGDERDAQIVDKDRKDETWVLYDRQLVDDELYALWSSFKAGVRILVLSDSCHSGTATREAPPMISGGPRSRLMPRSVGEKVEKAHARLYAKIQKDFAGAETVKVKASVLLISGCMDNQLSRDGDRNGAFTGMLKRVWNGGKFKLGYRRFRDLIAAKMPGDQTPNFFVTGSANRDFELERPFTV